MNFSSQLTVNMLPGDEETVKAVTSSYNKTIKDVEINSNILIIKFTDETTLRLVDEGQTCCERRYTSTEDELTYFIGATLFKIEITSSPRLPVEFGIHEVQFLDVHTSKGMFQVANHNEHNGYYGGFSIQAYYDLPTHT